MLKKNQSLRKKNNDIQHKKTKKKTKQNKNKQTNKQWKCKIQKIEKVEPIMLTSVYSFHSLDDYLVFRKAQSAEAIEYTDCISTEE